MNPDDLCAYCRAVDSGICESSGWCPKGHHLKSEPRPAHPIQALGQMLVDSGRRKVAS